MSDQSKQPPPKKPDPPPEAPAPAPSLPKVKVCWVKGGTLTDGRYDADRGIIHTTRARRPVMVSVHSGTVDWWALA